MNLNLEPHAALTPIDSGRRSLLAAAGAGVLTATLGGLAATSTRGDSVSAATPGTLRWGVVGTGGIANAMAPRINEADHAELTAAASRRMETALEFTTEHGGRAFDSWREMIAWDGIDAVYIATPTFVREEIAVAAANAGKHVLGEKPFANLASLQRITEACRANKVGFMDGTHFVHEPRTHQIRMRLAHGLGWPWSIASAFQFGLTDTSNIRFQPDLEPLGAIGDAGWYNMRAAVEYTPPHARLVACDAFGVRHPKTHAVTHASGVIRFDDGSTTTFNCGFDSGAGVQDLRLSGTKAVIKLDDFLRSRRDDHAGVYQFLTGWGQSEEVVVPSAKSGATLMFEDFAAMIGHPDRIEASIHASERTQGWLDAFWESAVKNA